jgi:tight adherence protein C
MDARSLSTALADADWARLAPLAHLSRLAQPRDADELDAHRRLLVQAGLRSRQAPLWFYATKVALAAVLAALAAVALQQRTTLPATWMLWAAPLAGAALGLVLPGRWLQARITRRQRVLRRALPDALDLMIVCVESGLSLDAAQERTAQEIGLRSPLMAEELRLVGTERRLGASRERALRGWAERTGVEEIRQFVAMVLQAERFGVRVGDALRVQAAALREQRQLRAEEAAAKMPLKLLFPLIFALFPALMVVLLGPAGIQLARQLGAMTGG